MRTQRIIFGDHASREMDKASLIQLVTREMVSETIFKGLRKSQRRGKHGGTVYQSNRFFGKNELRVVFEDTPWGCDLITILWEGFYD